MLINCINACCTKDIKVLSAISPDIILCGWLGSKYQLSLTCKCTFLAFSMTFSLSGSTLISGHPGSHWAPIYFSVRPAWWSLNLTLFVYLSLPAWWSLSPFPSIYLSSHPNGHWVSPCLFYFSGQPTGHWAPSRLFICQVNLVVTEPFPIYLLLSQTNLVVIEPISIFLSLRPA